jgi:hypothetical protein
LPANPTAALLVLPPALGDMDIEAPADGQLVTLRRRIKWRFLFPYALVAAGIGVLFYQGCADPAIAYLAPRPAAVLASLFGLGVFVVSAYGGLAPRVIRFDLTGGRVHARGHDAFQLAIGEISELRAEWRVHHPGTLARRRDTLLVVELLLVPRAGEPEPFAEGQARLGSPEAEQLRHTAGELLEGLAARLGRPCRQLQSAELDEGTAS